MFLLLHMKTIFLILLLVVFITTPSASGRCGAGDGRTKHVKLCHSIEVTGKTKMRKILSDVDVQDYRDPGPNPGHDPGPGKGKPGGKGINP
ncbi:hypothetical protein AgCh_039895 [Apium graveolens]